MNFRFKRRLTEFLIPNYSFFIFSKFLIREINANCEIVSFATTLITIFDTNYKQVNKLLLRMWILLRMPRINTLNTQVLQMKPIYLLNKIQENVNLIFVNNGLICLQEDWYDCRNLKGHCSVRQFELKLKLLLQTHSRTCLLCQLLTWWSQIDNFVTFSSCR